MNPTKLIRSIFAKRLSQIDRYADYGDIIQQKTLLDLLQKAKNTEFGTKFKFNDISSYKSFAENIPINGYEELKPYIERTMSGEQNILWPTPIRHFAKSSGTTNDKSKFIGIKIVFAGKLRILVNLGIQPQTGFNGLMHTALVQNRQHAGHAGVDKGNMLVGIGAENRGSAAEHFGLGNNLTVNFQTADNFPPVVFCFDNIFSHLYFLSNFMSSSSPRDFGGYAGNRFPFRA